MTFLPGLTRGAATRGSDITEPGRKGSLRRERRAPRPSRSARLALLVAICATSAGVLRAESVASKNREGNRLFTAGKYRDAEKAYLAAQGKDPGRPELLYNIGNTFLRQKSFDNAVQSLRQAAGRGDRTIRARAWYSAGNALFEMGRYRDSADAFIQTLRIDPRDQDAKHNLELALRRMREEQKNRQGGGQSPQQKEDESQSGQKPPDGQDRDQAQGPKPPQQPDTSPPQGQPANPQATQADRSDGTFSRERALQILDALQNQELAEQRRLLERRAKRKATGKDW